MARVDKNIVLILSADMAFGFGHIYASPVVQNNGITDAHDQGTLLNPNLGATYDWDSKYAHLGDMKASALYSVSDSADTFGWEVRYHDRTRTTLMEAERMVKALRRIETRLTKLSEQFGTPDTFGHYVARFADAIGCAKFAIRMDEVQPDGTYYKWLDADGMHRWVKAAHA